MVLCCATLGCAGAPPPGARSAGPPPAASDAGPLRSPDLLPYDFQWRQRVTASWTRGRQSFDAVLQKRDGELLLMGLSPMGQPGFVLRLKRDGMVELNNRTGRELPFPPAFILADVQRVFFPWLPAAGEADGERQGVVEGLRVVERRRSGQLESRSFERIASPGRRVQIRYQGSAGEDAPRHVELDNGWFDYRLVIDTIDQSRL